MPKEIPLKENEHYARKDLMALLEQLKTDRITVQYKNGQVCISEHTEGPDDLHDEPAPAPALTPAPTAPAQAPAIPDRIKNLRPWALRRLNNDKCNVHCKTDKTGPECRECVRWDAFT